MEIVTQDEVHVVKFGLTLLVQARRKWGAGRVQAPLIILETMVLRHKH